MSSPFGIFPPGPFDPRRGYDYSGPSDPYVPSAQAAPWAAGRLNGYDSLSSKPDGALGGRVSDDGTTWTATGSALPQVTSGVIGFATGVTVGNFYALRQAAGPVTVIAQRFRFDAADVVGGSVCFGLFDTATPGAGSSSPWHCSITPAYLRCSSFAGGLANEVVMRPVGWPVDQPRWARAIPCDGQTWVEVTAVLDKAAATGWLLIDWAGEYSVFEFRHPNLAIDARWVFVQSYSVTAGMENVGRWDGDRFGWSTVGSDGQSPWTSLRKLARATANRATAGAGPVGERPSSRRQPGSTWTVITAPVALTSAASAGDTTVALGHPLRPGTVVTIDTGAAAERRTITAIAGSGTAFTATLSAALGAGHAAGTAVAPRPGRTDSDGTAWRDDARTVVSNRIDPATASTIEDTVLGVGGATDATIRAGAAPAPAKWRHARVRRLTATAGTNSAPVIFYCYPATNVPAEPGEPFRALTALVMAQDTLRYAYLCLRFYNAAGAQLAEFVGATTAIPTDAPVALPQPRGVAPAGTVQANMLLFVAAAAGERFIVDGFCVVVAHGADDSYVRT